MSRTKAQKIVRRPDFAGGGITEDERAKMAECVKEWTRIAYRTDPIDSGKIVPAIRALYAAAGLPAPLAVVIVPSPLVMALAGGFAAAIWYARKHGAGATRAATWEATRAATDTATRAATEAATGEATEAATWEATRAATEAATWEATGEATRAATGAADAATRAAPCDTTSDLAKFMLNCAAQWRRMYQGGNMWAAWPCYLSAARDVLGLHLPEHEKYSAWEECAREGGFRIMHEKFCIVSDFPEHILIDAQNRPHCDDGPSHRWRDGWSLYHIHGVRVTQQIVERPDTITIAQIRDEKNAEVRRVMIDRYGEDRYILDSGMRPVAHDETFGTLYVEPQEAGTPIAKVRVINRSPEPDGTFKPYWLDINPAHYDGDAGRVPQAAVASTWRTAEGALAFQDYRDYRPAVET